FRIIEPIRIGRIHIACSIRSHGHPISTHSTNILDNTEVAKVEGSIPVLCPVKRAKKRLRAFFFYGSLPIAD
ncbi:MAG: hypothetical protein PHU80_10030, partial [Kiritimatiellae bacterium]|nr:hypothetical protein [Kiritimatiellia bacterium]